MPVEIPIVEPFSIPQVQTEFIDRRDLTGYEFFQGIVAFREHYLLAWARQRTGSLPSCENVAPPPNDHEPLSRRTSAKSVE